MKKQYLFWICLFETNVFLDMLTLVKSTELPNEYQEYCPYSDICNRTASQTLKKNDAFVSCCSSCRCDEECGLRLDCCFEHLDKYRLIEKGKISCIDNTVRYGTGEIENDVRKGYFMVQKCDNEGLNDNAIMDQCRLIDENGKSLISPVSSLDSNSIYVNKACAACNKVNMSLVKHWNYYIQSYRPKETALAVVKNNLNRKFGTLTFIPPPDENWSNKRCYDKYVGDENCLMNNKWQHLCHNLQARFRSSLYDTEIIFKNVFCFLCGAKSTTLNTRCASDAFRSAWKTQLTMLLNNAVIEGSEFSDFSKVSDIQKTENGCTLRHVEFMKNMCLPVYCPEGMLQTKNGCKYFVLRWFTRYLVMNVILVPEKGAWLPVSKIPMPLNPKSRYYSSWLQVPCRQRETFFELYYSSENRKLLGDGLNTVTREYVTSLVIRIWTIEDKMWKGIDPSAIIPFVRKCVTETWQAKLENRTYIFYPDFYKYSVYVQDGEQILKKWPGESKTSDSEAVARPRLYTPLVATSKDFDDFVLKKPFFCNQVRVPTEDVEVRYGEILIKSRNVTLGTNEYIVNNPVLDRGVSKITFSVCVEDYINEDAQRSGCTAYQIFVPETLFSTVLTCLFWYLYI